ncbi:Mycobacterium rhizamassiliense ORFan [Mycobacterium rhizamassiliense]|uniref:Mycobacterium numidiamassiliense ORFan n=2 Tax=Mycobacterium TaxID=1763 RepID=A0A2U3PA80_9MYCO|nr:Mycobacterium rhizamassiliense ORFan [Mycobacterium rhizamassiliense]SPM40636.1 Mycobacterium numidiamassiliense ORFan [Mycobacterium numidiamassiliense]
MPVRLDLAHVPLPYLNKFPFRELMCVDVLVL